MSLLLEIQTALLEPGQPLSSILLKLRYLASRLGSEPLVDWVRHEAEGYPDDVEVPDYRKMGVSYEATFSGPFGSGIKNAPIPTHLINKLAGQDWVNMPVRQSIAEIDDLISSATDGSGTLSIDASNLILLLQGKVYEGYACNSVTGTLGKSGFAGIQSAVRTRILELTIELEKRVPAAAIITLGPATQAPQTFAADTSRITNQIIYGDVTNISNVGDAAQFNIAVGYRDAEGFVKSLVSAGIAEPDAKELVEIVKSEEGGDKKEPFGKKAKAWFLKNIKKAGSGAWDAGVSVATEVITEATLKFYGLK